MDVSQGTWKSTCELWGGIGRIVLCGICFSESASPQFLGFFLTAMTARAAPGTLAEQTVLNFTLVKNKPTFQVPAEMLDDPPTPLARVLVILTNHEGRDNRWTGAKIKKLVRDHAWPDEDADQAIDQLIRAETLRKQSNNYLRFYRDQVRLVERTYEVPA